MTELHFLAEKVAAKLADAGKNPHSPWRTAALATQGFSGPDLRMLVLRRASPGQIIFYSDRRSPKCQQIQKCPDAALLFYDATEKEQLRLWGEVRLVGEGPEWDEALEGVLDRGAWHDYSGIFAPGEVLGELSHQSEIESVRSNFCLLVFDYRKADWLKLGRADHRRAKFFWQASGELEQAVWVAP
ncbi:MAG: pyridoxamine 5'-phosphate oxidase family protein [Verrucomicrobiales bacterium]